MPSMCRSKARLDGKTVIVTGANQGIGFETAKDLAGRGAKIILACRDLTRAQKAADNIKEETKNENIIVHQLNLASLASVRSFAQKINETEEQLNILINNAGVMAPPKMQTDDGFELQFGVNHLGHFLLTNLLLDLLKKSTPSRVVNVSSYAHNSGRLNFDDLQWEKRQYDPANSYGDSKIANVFFTRELARKLEGTGVTTYSLHPGVIKTDLYQHLGTSMGWKSGIINTFAKWFGKTVVQGAQTTIHCAVTEGLEDRTGQYFSDCAPKQPNSRARDDDVARRLWEVSEKLVGLSQQGPPEGASEAQAEAPAP
ncbi:RDH12 [Branchiostoma lanceolatum]|uniref:RDH12 protein n=1 Tax=Branchiostoma lanceolatum TaxID=7740 RepID=A0A8K0EMX0_BRALA|nr:RDH12 [Branchiostoma lanceolatum]